MYIRRHASFHTVNFYYRRCSELPHTGKEMQIGTSLLSFFTPLYFPHVLPKLHPFSSTNHQLSYQEGMRLKDKKEKSNESGRKREEKREKGWKCVDGYEERWESKVDREKIGKRGLKGLLRDGNTFDETRTSKDEKKDIVRISVLWNRKLTMMVIAKSCWNATGWLRLYVHMCTLTKP